MGRRERSCQHSASQNTVLVSGEWSTTSSRLRLGGEREEPWFRSEATQGARLSLSTARAHRDEKTLQQRQSKDTVPWERTHTLCQERDAGPALSQLDLAVEQLWLNSSQLWFNSSCPHSFLEKKGLTGGRQRCLNPPRSSPRSTSTPPDVPHKELCYCTGAYCQLR